MASISSFRILVELSPYSLQLARIHAGRVESFRECARESEAVAAALREILPAGGSPVIEAIFSPASGLLIRADASEAASIRTARSLLTYAGNVSSGLDGALKVIAWDSATGLPVETVGSSAWTLAATTQDELEAVTARLAGFGLVSTDVRPAIPARIGSVVTVLQDMPESTRVLLWDLAEANAHLAGITAGGCDAAAAVAAGYKQIFEAVQAALGLKFRAAATKLFLNRDYDFSETAGPIAERLASVLRPTVAALGGRFTTLHVSGLPSGQAWLAKAVATALDLAVWSPDLPGFCAQCELTGDAIDATLPPAALSLLFQAASGSDGDFPWKPEWLEAGAAPTLAPVATAAPSAVPAPVGAPSPSPSSKSHASSGPTLIPAQPPAKASTGSPLQPATEPVSSSVAIAEKPVLAAKPVTFFFAPLEKAADAPVVLPDAPEPFPLIEKAIVARPAAAPAEIAAPAKKKTGLILAVVAALAILGGGGAWVATRGFSSKDVEAAPPLSAEEQRLREVEDARLLAEELKSPRSFRNDRYNFEISDRGFLTKITGAKFTPFVDEFGWFELQGSFQNAAGKQEWFNAGGMPDRDYQTTVNKTVHNGVVVFEVTGAHPRFKLETLITCLPKSVKVKTVLTPIDMKDPRGTLSGVFSVKMTRKSLVPGQKTVVQTGGLSYETEAGPVSITFNRDAWGAGEAGKQTVAAGSNLVFFYFNGTADPKRNVLETELLLP